MEEGSQPLIRLGELSLVLETLDAGKMFGEFMGTLLLILLGDGVVAGVLLKQACEVARGRRKDPRELLRPV